MKKIVLTLSLFLLITIAAAQAIGQTRPTPTPTPNRAGTAQPTPTPNRTAAPQPTPARPAAPQTTSNPNAPVPESRIALIDTSMFADDKNGIFRYVDAVKALEPEFRARNQELAGLQARINTLVEDLRKLRQSNVVDQRTVQTKQEEGTRLQQDFNTKKQRMDEDASKRFDEVTAPISEQIGRAMDEFARQRGITMTLDLSKLMPALLTALPAVNVTEAFIADFNRRNPRAGTPPRP